MSDEPRLAPRFAQEDIRERYQAALATFVAKVRQDRYIIAAILMGSLAYDDVWEKSDVDILLIARDDKTAQRTYTLVEQGVVFHVDLGPRRGFKALVERSLQTTFIHSVMTKSVLLFSSDDTINDYYRNVQHVGARDRSFQLLNLVSVVVPTLTKAEKWLFVKHDPIYSFLWVMYLMHNLASIEVVLHHDIAGREVIQQALRYNPAFFTAVYLDLIQQPKDETLMRSVLQQINDYLEEKIPVLFKPILDFLADAGTTRSTTELHDHLKKHVQAEGREHLSDAYEWLARKGVIRSVFTPLRLTEKSHITLNEAAYYYDGDARNDEHKAEHDETDNRY